DLLKGQSKLELVHVIGPPQPAPHTTYGSEDEAKASLGGTVSNNRRVLPYKERVEKTGTPQDNANQEKPTKWVVVESPAIIDGSQLRTASAVNSRGGRNDQYEINLSLKKDGAEKFGAWTGAHINEYMGVVL